MSRSDEILPDTVPGSTHLRPATRLRSVSPAPTPDERRSKSASRSREHGTKSRSRSPSSNPRSASHSPSPIDDRSLEHDRSRSRSPVRQRRSRSRSSESNDRIAEAPVQPTATHTIRIENFVRPLRIDDVRDLVSKHGNVESLTMDKFKTHAIVKFSSRNEAAEAFQNLAGLQFQPESGKTLSVSYVGGESNGEEPSNSGGASIEAPAVGLGNGIPPPATDTLTLDHLFKKTVALPPLYWLPNKF